jgi:hypothetical protein
MPDHPPSRFVNVDELLPQLTVERVAAYYGVALPELIRVGQETRTRCFLACGKAGETGDRALAIQEGDPAKRWHCHSYGCGKGGNLVSLCDFLKPGPSMNGRPRGERFKAIADDLRAMVAGVTGPAVARTAVEPRRAAPLPVNLPLVRSENERARTLADLDRKFVTDVSLMPAAASAYVRRRPFLTSEAMTRWRAGYLPRDVGGEDKSGGTMRGKFVYGFEGEDGKVLTWFGRDPDFEEKRRAWEAGGRVEREPEKFHFVKGFHRGIELFGQSARRLQSREAREAVARYGVVVVEGPNDVIALDALGVPAVAICSNVMTDAQAEKVARFANLVADGRATVMLDCDEEGESGAARAVWSLSQRCLVRTAWSGDMFEGRFRGRQPESLAREEWEEIAARLASSAALIAS